MKKVYYGWIVCGVCTLLIFITMGTASNGLSVFMPYIMKSYGLTNAQTSSLVTLRCAFAFFAMLLVGKYYDRFGYRIGTGLAALCCCAAYVVYSFADGYPQFCIGASLAGVSYGLGSMIPVAIIMNRWFVRHRALAVGICASGSGIAVIILPPILTSVILRFSLQAAFLCTAAYTLAAAILVFLLVREKPADMGLAPLGQKERIEAYRREDRSVPAAAFESRALSSHGWTLMAAVCLIMGALSNPGFVHLTVLYSSEGFRPMTVALLVSVCGIVLTGGKILCGEAADLLGGFKASLLFSLLLLAGNAMCCLAFTGSTPLAMIAVILFGVGSPICTVGIPVWSGDLVSQDQYADTVRRLQLIYAAGAMIFATAPGVIADFTGSYIPVYALFSLALVLAIICLAAAYRKKEAAR